MARKIDMELSLDNETINTQYDLICIGMALVDSMIKGFNPEPVSASGYIAASGSLNVGGEAVNEAMAALVALGYSNSEILPVLRKIPDYGTLKREELIRKALQIFAKR